MPAPIGNTNALTHGCRAEHPDAQNAPNRVEKLPGLVTDYGYGIPSLGKPCTWATKKALDFRRDQANLIAANRGESVVWIEERVITKGKNEGKLRDVRRIHPAFAKMLQTATVQFRSALASGIMARLCLKKGDFEGFGKWQDREAKFMAACDRTLEQLGVTRVLEGGNQWWEDSLSALPDVAPQPASQPPTAEVDQSTQLDERASESRTEPQKGANQ